MKVALTLGVAAVLICAAFALHPGFGIAVALLAYGAIDGLLGKS